MSDYETRFGALGRLYGTAGLSRLRSSRVAVIGLGGGEGGGEGGGDEGGGKGGGECGCENSGGEGGGGEGGD